MALEVDGAQYTTADYWETSSSTTTSFVSGSRSTSSSYVDISVQEATVTNVGQVAGIYDPEGAAIFAMET